MDNFIGFKIKELRHKNKLSQKELCGNFMDRTLLSKIENNVVEPSITQLKYFADKCSVPLSYFFKTVTETSPAVVAESPPGQTRMLGWREGQDHPDKAAPRSVNPRGVPCLSNHKVYWPPVAWYN